MKLSIDRAWCDGSRFLVMQTPLYGSFGCFFFSPHRTVRTSWVQGPNLVYLSLAFITTWYICTERTNKWIQNVSKAYSLYVLITPEHKATGLTVTAAPILFPSRRPGPLPWTHFLCVSGAMPGECLCVREKIKCSCYGRSFNSQVV